MRLSQWLSPTLEDHQSIPVGRSFAGTPAAVWTLAVIFLMRGASSLTAYFTPIYGHPAAIDRLAIGVAAVLIGLLLFVPGLQVRDWHLQLGILAIVIAVAWLMATSPTTVRASSNLYGLVGVAVYVGAWFTTRQALLHMLFASVATLIALVARDEGRVLLATWITAILTCVGVMLLLHIIIRHQARAATLDPLTGVLTRTGLSAIVDRPVVAAQLRQPLSLAVLDLDGFKSVNDQHGHGAGDALLREVGDLLRAGTRESDVTARLGGDEFLIILSGTQALQAQEIVSRLVADLPIGASYGIVPWPPSESFDAVLRAADQAMYAQKLGRRPQP